MTINALMGLKAMGQSLWIDYLSRDLISSGELGRLMAEDGVCGVTSNPTIFQKAIEGSTLYDDQLQRLIKKGVREEKELYLALTMEDVSKAADMMLPVYESTGGRDGYVSIEVSPNMAYDTEATMKEAMRLFTGIGRKNVLIKVPATRPGLPAIEGLTADGVNVNVTLLFSVKRYGEVADAYLNGLERRVRAGQGVAGIASVASFFVSRVDTLVDRMLDERAAKAATKADKEMVISMRGRAAVASARLAYQVYKEIFMAPRFHVLKDKGASVQRLLWGSTGTKDPAYSDIKYVEELIGPDTVNTMPEETMTAFSAHGKVRATIEEGMDEARALMGGLARAGIDMEEVADQLEREGVKKFTDSFVDTLDKTVVKRDGFLREKAA